MLEQSKRTRPRKFGQSHHDHISRKGRAIADGICRNPEPAETPNPPKLQIRRNSKSAETPNPTKLRIRPNSKSADIPNLPKLQIRRYSKSAETPSVPKRFTGLPNNSSVWRTPVPHGSRRRLRGRARLISLMSSPYDREGADG
jgi:hypothetical protein